MRSDLDQSLIDAARAGDLLALQAALAAGASPEVDGEARALIAAAAQGSSECVKVLIPLLSCKERGRRPLRSAALSGRAECVRLLIPATDPRAEDSSALREAARAGEAECVRLLIPVSDPRAWDSEALVMAASSGCHECVRLLIPVSDVNAPGCYPLWWAADGGRAECVALLLPVCETSVGMIIDCAEAAREAGHEEVAGMIEAFFEAQELSREVSRSGAGARGGEACDIRVSMRV